MIIIDNFKDNFTIEEKTILENKCENFIATSIPDPNSKSKKTNYYKRNEIDRNDKSMVSIIEKINTHIKNNFKNINIFLLDCWINKIDESTNQNDSFHKDDSFMTFIIYLNDDFEGGEFEYILENNRKDKIKVHKYLTILSDHDLYHRVLPVTKGIRYSFVLFYDVIKKTEKTFV